MPSDKRARQRAYRLQKRAEQERRRKHRRWLIGSGWALLVVAIVVVVVALTAGHKSPPRSSSGSKSTSHSATSSTTPGTSVPTTTTVAASAPVCPPASGSPKRLTAFSGPPPSCIVKGATYDATVETNAGTFVVSMPSSEAPAAVNNFVFLARYHFFDGTTFPRVIPGFVIQGGSPNDTTAGGPGYSWTGNLPPASCVAAKDCYPNYSVAVANSGSPSSNGSQFFIVLPGGGAQLTRSYTRFGQVVSGTSVVDKIGAAGNSSPAANGIPPKVTYHIVKVTISTAAG